MTFRTVLPSVWVVVLFVSACFDPTHSEGTDTGVEAGTDGSSGGDGHDGAVSTASGHPSGSDDGDPGTGTATTASTGAPTSGGPSTSDPSAGTDPDDGTDASSDPDDDSGPTDPSAAEASSSGGACVPQCDNRVCGDEPVCGESCGSCDGGESCLDDGEYCGSEYGFPDDFGFNGNVNPDVLFGHRFTLPFAATLKRFGAIASGVATVRMVLYSDAGGPQNLVAQTGDEDLVAGSNELAIADAALAAGDYWVGLIGEGSVPLRTTAPGDDSYEQFYALQSFGDAFPAVLTTDNVVNDYRYNLYVVVDDG